MASSGDFSDCFHRLIAMMKDKKFVDAIQQLWIFRYCSDFFSYFQQSGCYMTNQDAYWPRA